MMAELLVGADLSQVNLTHLLRTAVRHAAGARDAGPWCRKERGVPRRVETLSYGDEIVINGEVTSGIRITRQDNRRIAIEASDEDFRRVVVVRKATLRIIERRRQAAEEPFQP